MLSVRGGVRRAGGSKFLFHFSTQCLIRSKTEVTKLLLNTTFLDIRELTKNPHKEIHHMTHQNIQPLQHHYHLQLQHYPLLRQLHFHPHFCQASIIALTCLKVLTGTSFIPQLQVLGRQYNNFLYFFSSMKSKLQIPYLHI